jgi:ABC-type lipoprotein export system ATPase subunit
MYTPGMEWLLEAGPFSAHDGEGRLLFSDAVVRLSPATAVVLDGPSGSGKSTLLRYVTGLAGGTGGSVGSAGVAARTLKGEPFQGDAMPAWRTRVTLVAQDAPMLPGSVRYNVEFPFRFRTAPTRTFDVERARSLMEEVGLEIPFDRDVSTLSGGERHRLALVRGLLWDSPVLVADEPLSGLDADAAVTCFELLLRFAHRPDHALLVVLHHRELGAGADQRIHLEKGRLEGV